MREVYEILKRIKGTPGTNDKKRILVDEKGNLPLRYVLDFLYNPFIVSGISTKKLNKFKDNTELGNINFNDNKELLEYIKDNNTGTDNVLQNVTRYINNTYGNELKEFMFDLITKSFKAGITGKSINAAFKERFIPLFDVMLARKYFDEKDKIKGDFFVTLKLDGLRIVCIKENGSINFFSRKGQPIEGLVELEEEFKLLPDNYVYDGELLLQNDNNLDSASLYRETMKIARKDGVKKDLEFHMFDLLPVSEFKQGKSYETYTVRRGKLDMISDREDLKLIQPVETLYYGNDKNKVDELLEEVTSKGLEGLMVSLADSNYELKRSKGLLKVKKFNSADVKIQRLIEGQGKYKGMLGAVVIHFGESNNEVEVGSGWTDELRKEIWNNQEKYIGSIIEINYFEVSKNSKTGLESLRFPTFKRLRLDRNTESWY